MLRKCEPDPSHVLDWVDVDVDKDVSYEEGPMQILDTRQKVLRGKMVQLVKVLWRHHGVEEVTWELEQLVHSKCPDKISLSSLIGLKCRLRQNEEHDELYALVPAISDFEHLLDFEFEDPFSRVLLTFEVCQDGRTINGGSISQGLQNITQISSTVHVDGKGNVHSGAPPPWFNATEANPLNAGLKPGLGLNAVASPHSKPGKSQKLNPKRVGAAWAEKRKIELEMERRGECITNNFDANWLPNFGRVWQSGSRKESRKEFEVEDKKPLKVETESETPIKIQPYISKRIVNLESPCTML
ncbi:TITAN-like protein [Cornus florida]|uniref:TITAN-like protein n=1 Tax=Cornus florida TaxID=4283 RepID=UPI00289EC98C|nr:TITAN-like protein [Cornus florida]